MKYKIIQFLIDIVLVYGAYHSIYMGTKAVNLWHTHKFYTIASFFIIALVIHIIQFYTKKEEIEKLSNKTK